MNREQSLTPVTVAAPHPSGHGAPSWHGHPHFHAPYYGFSPHDRGMPSPGAFYPPSSSFRPDDQQSCPPQMGRFGPLPTAHAHPHSHAHMHAPMQPGNGILPMHSQMRPQMPPHGQSIYPQQSQHQPLPQQQQQLPTAYGRSFMPASNGSFAGEPYSAASMCGPPPLHIQQQHQHQPFLPPPQHHQHHQGQHQHQGQQMRGLPAYPSPVASLVSGMNSSGFTLPASAHDPAYAALAPAPCSRDANRPSASVRAPPHTHAHHPHAYAAAGSVGPVKTFAILSSHGSAAGSGPVSAIGAAHSQPSCYPAAPTQYYAGVGAGTDENAAPVPLSVFASAPAFTAAAPKLGAAGGSNNKPVLRATASAFQFGGAAVSADAASSSAVEPRPAPASAAQAPALPPPVLAPSAFAADCAAEVRPVPPAAAAFSAAARASATAVEGSSSYASIGVTESPRSKAAFQTWHRQFWQLAKEDPEAAYVSGFAQLRSAPQKVHWRITMELADLARRHNRPELARTLYQTTLHLNPGASHAYMEYAKVAEEAGNLVQCLNILTLGLQRCSNPDDAMIIKTLKQHERFGDYAAARAILASVLDTSMSKSWRVIVEGALFEARVGSEATARRVFKYLKQNVSWYGPIYTEASKFEEVRGHYDLAERAIREGLASCPRYGPLWLSHVKVLQRKALVALAAAAPTAIAATASPALAHALADAGDHVALARAFKSLHDALPLTVSGGDNASSAATEAAEPTAAVSSVSAAMSASADSLAYTAGYLARLFEHCHLLSARAPQLGRDDKSWAESTRVLPRHAAAAAAAAAATRFGAPRLVSTSAPFLPGYGAVPSTGGYYAGAAAPVSGSAAAAAPKSAADAAAAAAEAAANAPAPLPAIGATLAIVALASRDSSSSTTGCGVAGPSRAPSPTGSVPAPAMLVPSGISDDGPDSFGPSSAATDAFSCVYSTLSEAASAVNQELLWRVGVEEAATAAWCHDYPRARRALLRCLRASAPGIKWRGWLAGARTEAKAAVWELWQGDVALRTLRARAAAAAAAAAAVAAAEDGTASKSGLCINVSACDASATPAGSPLSCDAAPFVPGRLGTLPSSASTPTASGYGFTLSATAAPFHCSGAVTAASLADVSTRENDGIWTEADARAALNEMSGVGARAAERINVARALARRAVLGGTDKLLSQIVVEAGKIEELAGYLAHALVQLITEVGAMLTELDVDAATETAAAAAAVAGAMFPSPACYGERDLARVVSAVSAATADSDVDGLEDADDSDTEDPSEHSDIESLPSPNAAGTDAEDAADADATADASPLSVDVASTVLARGRARARLLLTAAARHPCADWKASVDRVFVEVRAGRSAEARALLRTAIARFPGTGRLWSLRIALAQEQGFEEQSRMFQLAVKETPKSGEVWCEGAKIALNPTLPSFSLKTAAEFLRFAVHFTPQYGDSFVELLRVKMLSFGPFGDHESMQRLRNLCINTDPNYGLQWNLHRSHAPLMTVSETFVAVSRSVFADLNRYRGLYQRAVTQGFASPALYRSLLAGHPAALLVVVASAESVDGCAGMLTPSTSRARRLRRRCAESSSSAEQPQFELASPRAGSTATRTGFAFESVLSSPVAAAAARALSLSVAPGSAIDADASSAAGASGVASAIAAQGRAFAAAESWSFTPPLHGGAHAAASGSNRGVCDVTPQKKARGPGRSRGGEKSDRLSLSGFAAAAARLIEAEATTPATPSGSATGASTTDADGSPSSSQGGAVSAAAGSSTAETDSTGLPCANGFSPAESEAECDTGSDSDSSSGSANLEHLRTLWSPSKPPRTPAQALGVLAAQAPLTPTQQEDVFALSDGLCNSSLVLSPREAAAAAVAVGCAPVGPVAFGGFDDADDELNASSYAAVHARAHVGVDDDADLDAVPADHVSETRELFAQLSLGPDATAGEDSECVQLMSRAAVAAGGLVCLAQPPASTAAAAGVRAATETAADAAANALLSMGNAFLAGNSACASTEMDEAEADDDADCLRITSARTVVTRASLRGCDGREFSTLPAERHSWRLWSLSSVARLRLPELAIPRVVGRAGPAGVDAAPLLLLAAGARMAVDDLYAQLFAMD